MCLRAFHDLMLFTRGPPVGGRPSRVPHFIHSLPTDIHLRVLRGEELRIFIADADRELRLALQILLHQEAGMHVTGIAVRTEGLAAQVAASQPDVLLLDWHLPGGSIAEVLAELGQSVTRPQLVILSVNPEIEQDAMAAGADFFVAKNAPPSRLLESLRSIEARS